MTVLTNNFDGGTAGTTLTTANTGGVSGNAADLITIGSGATLAFDNTRTAHGLLSAKAATTGVSAAALWTWSTSMGSQNTIWFRVYVYQTANLPAANRLIRVVQGATLCAAITIQANGTIQGLDSTGTQQVITTSTVPLNQWFRIEGFVTGSAAAGQIEIKLFKNPDSTVPDETQTSAATLNTTGAPNTYTFGITTTTNVIGPFWMDDIGLSSTGYVGPATPATASPAFGPRTGIATATTAVTTASLIPVPAGPAAVLLANAGTASPVYFAAGTAVTTANGFPLPSGLVGPVSIPVYLGSPAGTWSVITTSGTATVSWLISLPAGGTGPSR